MHEATIKAEFVNPPDKNPDYGSIKADGKYWSVPANMVSQFQKGQTYTVGYTTTGGRSGKTFYNIKELRANGKPAVSMNGQAPGKDQHMISALALYNHSFPAFAARSDGEIERSLMGNFLFECMLAVDWAQSKHKKFWSEKQAPKPEPEMNDEIPF